MRPAAPAFESADVRHKPMNAALTGLRSGSLDQLRANMDTIRAAIARNLAQSSSTPAGKTSDFWAEVFGERPNYPDLNAIMAFRREGFAYGIGDDRQGDLPRERSYSERTHHIFRRMVGREFVAAIPETTFGAPFVFEHDGLWRSASFWINAATTQRVAELLRRHGTERALRVLEIGAGWGACVYQLHHALDIRNYTIVDLPQNLYISTVHLGTVMPERGIEFIDNVGEPICEFPPKGISACLPGAIGRIRASYDLVLNSFSLQEMAIETVTAYIDWIEGLLSEEGIFVSINSHGKAGVRQPSDYRYGRFHIHHWGVFRQSPSGFFNTIPYEVVLGARRAHSPDYPPELQDGLGFLMQTGLDRDLQPLADALARGSLTAPQRSLLSEYNRLFCATSDADRLKILQAVRGIDASPIAPFIAALLALVRNDLKGCGKSLEDACRRGLSGFANVKAKVLLAGLDRKAGKKAAPIGLIDGLDPALAYPEAAAIIETGELGSLADQTNRVLRRDCA